MSLRVVNFIATAVSLLIAITFFTGVLSQANAFFGALTIVTVYTGYQLSLRDGKPLLNTVMDLIAKPSSHPRRAAYFAYVGSMALGSVVVLQSLSGAV